MTSLEKTGLARILVDLIQADNILDLREMEYLSHIEHKYKLTRENFIAGQKINFALAVSILKRTPIDCLSEILEDMKTLTLTDGYCSPSEAYWVMALLLCLNPDSEITSELISTTIENVSIEPGNFLYIETEYDADANNILENVDLLRYISVDFKYAGLNFVYIPQVSNDFKSMDPAYLKSVIRFLAPTLKEERQTYLFDTLRKISTKEFCDEFLINKMGLDSLADTDPSILFQIGKSNDKLIYLHVNLSLDILKDFRQIVDLYTSLTNNSIRTLSISNDTTHQFIYSGFHKSLFDLMAFPGKNVESRILIDTFKHRINFIDLGETLILPSKQLALYLFIIQQSVCTNKHELTIETTSYKIKERNQRIFEKIYGFLSSSECSDFTIGLTPALAKIKKAISKIHYLDNPHAYIPERTNGSIRIRIKPFNIYVMDTDGNSIPISESEKWNNL